jgi:hypothetical protein
VAKNKDENFKVRSTLKWEDVFTRVTAGITHVAIFHDIDNPLT